MFLFPKRNKNERTKWAWLQMNKDESVINLLLSALDYIDQGTLNMSINQLFTDDFTTKIIAFTRY